MEVGTVDGEEIDQPLEEPQPCCLLFVECCFMATYLVEDTVEEMVRASSLSWDSSVQICKLLPLHERNSFQEVDLKCELNALSITFLLYLPSTKQNLSGKAIKETWIDEGGANNAWK